MTQVATAEAKDDFYGDTQMSLTIPINAILISEMANGAVIFGSYPSDIRAIHVLTPLSTTGTFNCEGTEVEYSCSIIPQILPNESQSKYLRKLPVTFEDKIFGKAQMRMPQLLHQLKDKGMVIDEQSTSYDDRDYMLRYKFTMP